MYVCTWEVVEKNDCVKSQDDEWKKKVNTVKSKKELLKHLSMTNSKKKR
jgi:hypothetical protein